MSRAAPDKTIVGPALEGAFARVDDQQDLEAAELAERAVSAQENFSSSVASRRPQILAVLAAAVTMTLVSLTQSLERGRLSFLPSYDDLVYLTSAVQIHALLNQPGLGAWLAAIIDPTYHSPPFSALGAVGYGLFGLYDFAPYAAMGLPLFAVVWLMACRLRAFQGDAVGTAIFVALAFTPLLQFLIAEFRPDFTWGLFLAYGSFRVYADTLEDSQVHRNRWPWHASVAYSLGVVIKPQALIASLALLLGTCGLLVTASILDGLARRHRPMLRPAFGAAGRFALLCIALCLPLLWTQLPSIYSYTIDTMITHVDAWGTPLPLLQVLSYYPNFLGIILGGSVTVIAAVALLALASALLSRRSLLALGGAVAIVVMTYAVPTLPRNKTVYFGAAFYASLMWSAVFLYPTSRDAILEFAQARGGWRQHQGLARACTILLGAVLVFAAIRSRPIDTSVTFSRQNPYLNQLDTERRSVAAAVLKVLAGANLAKPMFPPAGVVLTIYSNTIGPFDPDTIRYQSLKQALKPPNFSGSFLSLDLRAEVSQARASDMAVLPEPAAFGLVKQFPGYQITDAISTDLAANTAFLRLDVGVFRLPSGMRLYARADRILHVVVGDGWGEAEAAPTGWSGGTVRRMAGPRAQFDIGATGPLGGVLHLLCRSEGRREWTVSVGAATQTVTTDSFVAPLTLPFMLAADQTQRVTIAAAGMDGAQGGLTCGPGSITVSSALPGTP